MNFSILKDDYRTKKADCLILGINSNYKPSVADSFPEEIKKIIKQAFDEKTFTGEFKSVRHFTISERPYFCSSILLVGLGDSNEQISSVRYKKLIDAVYQQIKMQAYSSITILLDGFIQNRSCSSCIKSFVGELSFQNYRYTEYKSKPETPYNPDIAFATVEDDAEEALAYSTVLKDAIDEARDLQHTPGNVGNSVYFAGKAKELENKYSSVSVKILGRSELKQEKMSAYLAVCSGSSNPPQMCIINYRGAGEQVAPVAIVGKGLTFDSGGLSLKPASGMDEMKYDKCGACVVIALMDAIARLGLKINVVGVAAFAENMPDADSYRPGDLITARNGLNIEVANTDAEGRMVLCDAISYTVDTYNPEIILDLATLTGGCIVALGHIATGLIANDDNLAKELIAAGEKSNDKVWRLPLDEEYQELIDSKLADITNSAGREASPVTAGAFLSRFTGNIPWAHLDIAGTAWNSNGYKHPTGRPLALLLEYVVSKAGK